jgi:Na+/melibiose symporter-like transporter
MFILTQFLQFNLGFSALDAGLRMLPIAAAVAIASPLSATLVRIAGTKLTTAAGMLGIAVGLWLTSHASADWSYGTLLPGLIIVGAGVGLAMPSVSGSVIGSVPRRHTGVGSATNGTFMQMGGALGVAVLGSLLSAQYQQKMTASLAPYHVAGSIQHTILDSIGSALAVADRVGGIVGHALALMARSAFISGADLALFVAAIIALIGCAIALAALPSRVQPPVDLEEELSHERSAA